MLIFGAFAAAGETATSSHRSSVVVNHPDGAPGVHAEEAGFYGTSGSGAGNAITPTDSSTDSRADDADSEGKSDLATSDASGVLDSTAPTVNTSSAPTASETRDGDGNAGGIGAGDVAEDAPPDAISPRDEQPQESAFTRALMAFFSRKKESAAVRGEGESTTTAEDDVDSKTSCTSAELTVV